MLVTVRAAAPRSRTTFCGTKPFGGVGAAGPLAAAVLAGAGTAAVLAGAGAAEGLTGAVAAVGLAGAGAAVLGADAGAAVLAGLAGPVLSRPAGPAAETDGRRFAAAGPAAAVVGAAELS